MDTITLAQILSLVGTLDDSPGEASARERFRAFLNEHVTEVGQIRDYLQECLLLKGTQYARALQDLVNHLGKSLGFEVTFGRYAGVPGQIGFDGLWKSPTGLYAVIEVKTTEAYSIKTSTLLNYVNDLISEKHIPVNAPVLGLYVVGRVDPDLKQLENSISAEKQSEKLRIISVQSLLSLADLLKNYGISHDSGLMLLKPSGAWIDPTIDLITGLLGEQQKGKKTVENGEKPLQPHAPEPSTSVSPDRVFWLTPVKSYPEDPADECIKRLVGKVHIYAFGENTNGRKKIKPGDMIAFYSSGKGVVAHATVASSPENKPNKAVHDSASYPWVFAVKDPALYIDNPVVLGPELRAGLNAFQGKDAVKNWSWFVQGTGPITEHDFWALVRAKGKAMAGQ